MMATGANRWRTNRDAAVGRASPVAVPVNGKRQIVAAGTYTVKGYEFDTGAELWTVGGMEMQCDAGGCRRAGFSAAPQKNMAQALRVDGGAGRPVGKPCAWKATRKAAFVPSAIAYDGHYLRKNRASSIALTRRPERRFGGND